MRAISLVVVASTVFAPRALSQQDFSPEVTRLFHGSVVAAEHNDLRAAIAMTDTLLQQDSTVLDALWNLGIWHATLNEPRQALRAWLSYHGQDSADWRVEAKIIQSYQAIGDSVRRDSALAGLLRHRRVTKNPELRQAEAFCREQGIIEGRSVMVFQTFEPRSPRMIFVTFHLVDTAGNDTGRISLGSYDATTQVERELGRIGANERIYHLDYYTDRGHATYGFFRALPTYDQVRALVVAILRGDSHPLSSTTYERE